MVEYLGGFGDSFKWNTLYFDLYQYVFCYWKMKFKKEVGKTVVALMYGVVMRR